MTPTSFSTSTVSTITIASQGQPSRNATSGPLLVHFLHPIQSSGSTWIRPNGGWSSSGTQNMQSSTGQYSTQAGDPAQPVQHSVITASSFGFFFRTVVSPFERGSYFNSSGTIPGCFCSVSAAMLANYNLVQTLPLAPQCAGRWIACSSTKHIQNAPRYSDSSRSRARHSLASIA